MSSIQSTAAAILSQTRKRPLEHSLGQSQSTEPENEVNNTMMNLRKEIQSLLLHPSPSRDELKERVRKLAFYHLTIAESPAEFREMLKLVNDIEGYKVEKKEIRVDSLGLTAEQRKELSLAVLEA